MSVYAITQFEIRNKTDVPYVSANPSKAAVNVSSEQEAT
jgi:hypothetical protein